MRSLSLIIPASALLVLMPVVGHAQNDRWTLSLGIGRDLSFPSGRVINPNANLTARGAVSYHPVGSPILVRLGLDYVRTDPVAASQSSSARSRTLWKLGAMTFEGVVPITSGKVSPYVALGGGAAVTSRFFQGPSGVKDRRTVYSPVVSAGVGVRSRLLGIPLQVEARWLGLTDSRIVGKQWLPLTVGFWF